MLPEESSIDTGTSVMDPPEREPESEVMIYIGIIRFIVIAPLTEILIMIAGCFVISHLLICYCPLLKEISFNTKCSWVWCD